ncbi:MAG: chemotaxis response regulator protein-glutamate methylesterase [Oceanospirillaceae bacterium]|nr:chemotaxis response regulator protein-glutamate methylesterase [Oceanospirillaceae bacterium]
MAIKLLVVDDSGFFQRRIAEILKSEPDIKIVGFANNGREAIEKTRSLSPDVITMDYEMPVMDGITALRNIMAERPTPVLMFSSLSYEGARVTLNALEAGAVDFLPKNFEDLQKGGDRIRNMLTDKIKSVAREFNRGAASSSAYAEPVKSAVTPAPVAQPAPAAPKVAASAAVVAKAPSVSSPAPSVPLKAPSSATTRPVSVDIVVIGTSTGGPVALQKVLMALPANFPKPIVLVQHMPATFTAAFAERLDSMCALHIKQAEDNDLLKPGTALLAPGGMQLMVDKGKVHVIPGDSRLSYKPSVDIAFASAAKHYPGKTLGIVLTGMGADGKEGARLIKESGAFIWAQDEATSVIYGMPMAVAKANLTDAILPLQDIAPRLIKDVR